MEWILPFEPGTFYSVLLHALLKNKDLLGPHRTFHDRTPKFSSTLERSPNHNLQVQTSLSMVSRIWIINQSGPVGHRGIKYMFNVYTCFFRIQDILGCLLKGHRSSATSYFCRRRIASVMDFVTCKTTLLDFCCYIFRCGTVCSQMLNLS